jgi:hypothetical protein
MAVCRARIATLTSLITGNSPACRVTLMIRTGWTEYIITKGATSTAHLPATSAIRTALVMAAAVDMAGMMVAMINISGKILFCIVNFIFPQFPTFSCKIPNP